MPRLVSLTLAFALQLRKKARENLSQGSQRMLLPITKTPTQLQYPPYTHLITVNVTGYCCFHSGVAGHIPFATLG